MEIYQLKHFVTLAETGSFTKAALRLCITQPALSGSIARLEADLGVQLFLRGRKVTALTTAGQKLLVSSKYLINAFGRLKLDIQESTAPVILRIGILRTFPTKKLTDLFTALKHELLGLQIVITEGTVAELEEQLANNKLDVLLTILGKPSVGAIFEKQLLTERYMLYVHEDHPFASKASLMPSDLEGQPFIVRMSCETFTRTTELFRKSGVRTRVVCRTFQDERALELVRAGIGVALMPELYESPGVAKVEIQNFVGERRIGLRWLENNDETVRRFRLFAESHSW